MSFAADVLSLLAKHEPTAGSVGRIGLSADQVRRLTKNALPAAPVRALPTAEETRRSLNAVAIAARSMINGRAGRRGLPDHVVSQMYAEYTRGKSLSQVAQIFGGSRQSVHGVFETRGLPLRKKKRVPKIEYAGRSYTMGKDYIRATEGDRKPLHHAKWEDAHGLIPDGCQVSFKNADRADVRLDNLFCAPIVEVTLYHHRRHLEERKAS